MGTYNGHKNWNYWNVSLWLYNDEGLYNLMKDVVRESKTKKQAAENIIQDLNDIGIYQTPDGAKYTKSAVLAAIRELE